MANIIVPWETLSGEALQGIAETFILREGTDYGLIEYSLEEKTKAVINQVKLGEVSIVYDDELETCNIMTQEMLRQSSPS